MRTAPMPWRAAFGPAELEAIQTLFAVAWNRQDDFGYQGEAERAYTEAFVTYLGSGGYADAVCSGTAAIYVGLAALALPEGSHVLVSCVTDPGTLNAIILNRLVPVLVDTQPGTYTIGPSELEARITPQSKALLVVHCTGQPAPMLELNEMAARKGLFVVEDCSQAHGAHLDGRKVGTFGHLAMFSTMYTKAHSTGGTGGVVFTRDVDLHRLARAHADRGKAFWTDGFNDRDPGTNIFPALNLNLGDLSCAVGLASLSRLDAVIAARRGFLKHLASRLQAASRQCGSTPVGEGDSPYFHVIGVDSGRLSVDKITFATAIRDEGIPVKPHYPLVASRWPYLRSYLSDEFSCPNALAHQAASFNLLFNEHFGDQEVEDIVAAIAKVEQVYAR